MTTEIETEPLDVAIRRLRDAGWRVSPPPCPECLDYGFVMRTTITKTGGDGISGGDATVVPCPRGCPQPVTT